MALIQEIIIKDENGNKAVITDTGQMHVVLMGTVDTDNSTSTPLGIDGVFTGDWVDTLEYAGIIVTLNSDQISATDGLELQWSTDGTNVDSCDEFTFENVDSGKTFSFQPAAKYYRIVYTNGGVAQTYFRLQSQLKKTNFKPSTHRIQDSIVDDDDATLVKAVMTGKNAQGEFINFSGTNGGNFKVSIEEFDDAVAQDMESFSDNMDGETGLITAAGMYGRVDDDTLVPVKLDGSTQDVQVVEHEHAEIHGGDHYYICDYQSLSNGQVVDFTLTTPDTAKWIHLTFGFAGTGAISFELFEGATVNVAGTDIDIYNNNRNSSNVAGGVARIGDTFSATGTSIYNSYAGANKVAGFIERGREFVLKQNTVYIFRVTNQLSNANVLSYCGEWYEHTDKN